MEITSRSNLKELLGISKTKQVLDYLLEIAKKNRDEQMQNDIVQLSNAYHQNERQKALGTLEPDNYRIENTRINNSLLYFIDAASDKYFEEIFSSKTTQLQPKAVDTETYKLRFQLNNLLQQLVSTYEYEFGLNNQHPTYDKQWDYISEKRAMLTLQAVWVIERIPNMVFSKEYNLVARMLYSIRDFSKSEQYHKKAVEVSESSFNLISHVRSYADFLYLSAKPIEGAKQYDAALLPNDTDENKAINGFTYQMRFRNEAIRVSDYNYEEAKRIYHIAKQHYESINNLRDRNYWLNRLDKDWANNLPHVPKP
jgi:hypothetical protein